MNQNLFSIVCGIAGYLIIGISMAWHIRDIVKKLSLIKIILTVLLWPLIFLVSAIGFDLSNLFTEDNDQFKHP